MRKIILKECKVKTIINLTKYVSRKEPTSITQIMKKSGMTYYMAYHIMRMYEKIGIVTITKKGRSNQVLLTEKGYELKNHVLQMDYLLKQESKSL